MSKPEDKPKQKCSTTASKKNPLLGMNTAKMSNMRIIQKHLVYVIGLSSTLANKEVTLLTNFKGTRKIRILWSIRYNRQNCGKQN